MTVRKTERLSSKQKKSRRRGSALIAVIAAIAIFSVLAAALLSMTSTSNRQTVMAHLADKAYYLAESGYRFAVSQYRNAADPYTVLENLNGSYPLSDAGGRFDLEVFSHFFVLSQYAPAGALSIVTRAPGNFPLSEVTVAQLVNQKIQINDSNDSVDSGYTINSASEADGNLILGISVALAEELATGTRILPVTDPGTTPWDSINKTISFKPGFGNMFPLRNGRIQVGLDPDFRILTYRLKVGSSFTGVRDPDDPDMDGFTIPSDARITLLPYVRISSTGIYGSGDAEVRRRIDYYGSLPKTFSDPFPAPFQQ